MNTLDYVKRISCKITRKKDAVGKVVLFDNQLDSNHYSEKEIKAIFKKFYQHQADEFLNARIIEEGHKANGQIYEYEYFETIGFLDSSHLKKIFKRNVLIYKMDFLNAFNNALDEYLEIGKNDTFYPSTEVKFKSVENLRRRLLLRLETILIRRKIEGIKEDCIVVVSEFKKEYFYNLPEYIKGFICKKNENYELAEIYANEYSLSIAICDYEFFEGKIIIIDSDAKQIILNPDDHLISIFKSQMMKSLEYIAQGPSVSLDPITLFTFMCDTRNLDIITKSEWFSGICMFKSEFLYGTKGTIPTLEEQTKMYVKILKKAGEKEVFINLPDFRPDKPTDIIGDEYTDINSYIRLHPVFNTHLNAVAEASRITKKVVSIVVPMIRLNFEMDFWVDCILAAFEFAGAQKPLIGMMVETETTLEFFEDFKTYDFSIIGLDNLVEEMMDDHNRYSPVEMEDFMFELVNDLRDLHQYYRTYFFRTRHIVVGHCLNNPNILLKLMRLGFKEFSVSVEDMPYIGETIEFFAKTRGTFKGVAAERKEQKKIRDQEKIEKEQRKKKEEEEEKEKLKKIEERKKKYKID